jgi:prepilin-type N-terminal cleavage/methylation domain-containing protein
MTVSRKTNISMKQTTFLSSGFSLLEIITTIAIVLILSVVGLNALSNYNKRQSLKANADMVLSVLSEARSRTTASEGSSRYGVHFEESKAVLFRESYVAGGVENVTFNISGPVKILNITIAGGSDVLFKKISGETDNNGSLAISLNDGSASIEIDIEKTGNSFILEN